MGPQPKRCHHCKSVDHLIADCPSRSEKKNNKEKSTNNNNNDDCCCDNNKDLRHTVHLGKVLLVKEEDDDEDDEDVQLHDHRINCSSSPASSCSSPLGKRELMWFLSLTNILKTLHRAHLYTNRWLKIARVNLKKLIKMCDLINFMAITSSGTKYCTDVAERISKWSLTCRSWSWLSWYKKKTFYRIWYFKMILF